MNDLPVHLLLFAAIGAGIVALAAFYTEADDVSALRGMPRRFAMFVLGCAILAALMVAAEHTVSSVR